MKEPRDMDWFLDFKLWENANLYSPVPLTEAQRQERRLRAVIAKSYSRNCLVILVDFKGGYQWPRLTAPDVVA
jgi:hypothetical protein